MNNIRAENILLIFYTAITEYLDFNDIVNLIHVLNIKNKTLEYKTITITDNSQLRFFLENITHFNYLNIVIKWFRPDDENIQFIKHVKSITLDNFFNYNISSLFKLQNIKNLEIICYRGSIDITYLISPTLEKLDLYDCCINQIPIIKNIPNLKKLSAPYNNVETLRNLDSTKLTFLDLTCNKITKIENLENVPNLVTLILSFNMIRKIQNLNKLKHLKYLRLDHNFISKIENIPNSVTNLNLGFNLIRQIENLKDATDLKVLDVTRNKIQFIKILKYNKSLKILFIRGNFPYFKWILPNVKIIS